MEGKKNKFRKQVLALILALAVIFPLSLTGVGGSVSVEAATVALNRTTAMGNCRAERKIISDRSTGCKGKLEMQKYEYCKGKCIRNGKRSWSGKNSSDCRL